MLKTIQAISGRGAPLLNTGLQYNRQVGKKVYLGIESQAILGEESFLIIHSNLMMTLGMLDHNFTTKLSVFSYGESLSAEEVVAGISLAYKVRLSKHWALVSENYLYTEMEDPFFSPTLQMTFDGLPSTIYIPSMPDCSGSKIPWILEWV